MKAAFSIDLEDWYQGIEKPLSQWGQYQHRLEHGFEKLLELLDKNNTKATFFSLGWIAAHYPSAIKKIADGGHELGSHTYCHEKVYDISPEKFREEISSTKKLLEDLSGTPVISHRSPFFSITAKSLWALDILKEEGFEIDCSISPIKTWRYGIAACPDEIFTIEENGLIEFPVSKFNLLGKSWALGGAYFRLFPYFITAKAMKNRIKSNLNTMFYIHPWEYDMNHPVVDMEWKAKFTHYQNLGKTYPNTKKLLKDFEFDTVRNIIRDYAAANTMNSYSKKILLQG